MTTTDSAEPAGTAQPFSVERSGVTLAGERWGDDGPAVVLLHEGVADRRSWRAAAHLLSHHARAFSYDRRGFGETPAPTGEFSHVDDLLAVLDDVSPEPVWLAGTSAGGGLALEAAIVAPERVAGLLLLAPGVSGAPMPELDPDTARFDRLLDEAVARGDLGEVNRLETWLWLDGPSQPEGRVGGATRALALEMNRVALANGVPEEAGKSGIATWERVVEVDVPAIVAYGGLDVPFLVERCHELVRRLPNATLQVIEGVAHLSELERPDVVAGLVVEVLARG